MQILFLDCGMGAAGDMIAGALLDLLDDKNAFVADFQALKLPGVELRVESARKCGIVGQQVRMLIHGKDEDAQLHTSEHHAAHEHPHHHTSMADIDCLLSALPLESAVVSDAQAVYHLIAQAEAQVHGVEMTEIHFHEVGTLDAVADVVACSMLMHRLQPERIVASPVRVGHGQIHCAHGVLPVPAPAAAQLLRGIPTYAGEFAGEFCTPTGAALLRHFANAFGTQPSMAAEKIGYGMGTRDFPAANCVRTIYGRGI